VRCRALIPILVVLLGLLGASVAAAEEVEETPTVEVVPALGAKAFAAPYGAGFGMPEPKQIFNGGDPNGEVREIKWTGWGNPSAIGYGRNPIFKPGGGYYRAPARIELRATVLGKCGKKAAYTRLEARVPKHPGGKLGAWQLWAGAKTICKPPR
jgi:hypothetical protein